MRNKPEGTEYYKCCKCGTMNKVSEMSVKRYRTNSGELRFCYSYCNKCRSKITREWKASHKEAVLSHNHKARKKYDNKFPIKKRAWYIAYHNMSEIKKDKCEVCGVGNKLEMHHPDYNKPLRILTLCGGCHRNLHRERKEE